MLINIEQLTFAYIQETLLEDINATIHDNSRIGLIGNNGVGKTTLINLLLNKLEPTSGTVKTDNTEIGYLAQNAGLDSDNTVYDEMKSVFLPVLQAMQKQNVIHQQLAVTPHQSVEYKSLSNQLDRLDKYIISKDGYGIDVKIKTVLNGMGFQSNYEQIVNTMSGGEKTRLAIAKLLLQDPDLLILDEPTNHLDFKTLVWLENYLTQYKHAMLIVSHDRFFLDKLTTSIWEIEDKQLEVYSGNYTKYKVIKQELTLYRLKEYEKQQRQISSMVEYAQKNIARDSTSNSAKSRLHQLANMRVLDKPRTYTKPPHFSFTFAEESSQTVLRVKDLTLQAGTKMLIENATFDVNRTDRVAILGANGTGKSTLVRKLFSNQSSHITYGTRVKTAYYDQENTQINPNNTVLEELWGRHHLQSQTSIRSILGAALLGEGDVFKKCSQLSGGERAKLGLCIVSATNSNTLILDEPTNHLDLATREALEDALLKFEGTVIFVSHDRYFLDKIATRILELDNLTITPYIGNYSQYLAQKSQEKVNQATISPTSIKPQVNTHRTSKDRSAEIKHKQTVTRLESEIEQLEDRKEQLMAQMCLPENTRDYVKMQELSRQLDTVKRSLAQVYDAWLELSE